MSTAAAMNAIAEGVAEEAGISKADAARLLAYVLRYERKKLLSAVREEKRKRACTVRTVSAY